MSEHRRAGSRCLSCLTEHPASQEGNILRACEECGLLSPQVTPEYLPEELREGCCHDCGVLVTPVVSGRAIPRAWEWYAVTDQVWEGEADLLELQEEAVCEGWTLYLCVGCLEARIGREIRPEDFNDYPVNGPSPTNAKRLRSRLEGWADVRTAAKIEIARQNGDERLLCWLEGACSRHRSPEGCFCEDLSDTPHRCSPAAPACS